MEKKRKSLVPNPIALKKATVIWGSSLCLLCDTWDLQLDAWGGLVAEGKLSHTPAPWLPCQTVRCNTHGKTGRAVLLKLGPWLQLLEQELCLLRKIS